jgi:hypothetical protein
MAEFAPPLDSARIVRLVTVDADGEEWPRADVKLPWRHRRTIITRQPVAVYGTFPWVVVATEQEIVWAAKATSVDGLSVMIDEGTDSVVAVRTR